MPVSVRRTQMAPSARSAAAQATRVRILAAARVEFVTEGLNGARVDRIAERARTNKNLIYHHFGSKDGLYLTVLEKIYSALRASQNDTEVARLSPLEGMRALVANTFDHFVATPDLIRLMSIENIHYGRHLKQSPGIKQLYAPLLTTIRDLIARGEADGTFRKGIDPVELYLSISGLAYFTLSNQHTLSWLLDRELASPRRLAARRAHIVDVISSYLQDRASGDRVRVGKLRTRTSRANVTG